MIANSIIAITNVSDIKFYTFIRISGGEYTNI